MADQISSVRKRMSELNIHAYFLPHNDYHNVIDKQSEYLGKHDGRVEFISGFKGSNSQVLITQEEALLWTDGRYWIAVIFSIGFKRALSWLENDENGTGFS